MLDSRDSGRLRHLSRQHTEGPSQTPMNPLETIEVELTVELGATMLPIHHLLRMGRGAVIELDASEKTN